jgi:hypothetical protein
MSKSYSEFFGSSERTGANGKRTVSASFAVAVKYSESGKKSYVNGKVILPRPVVITGNADKDYRDFLNAVSETKGTVTLSLPRQDMMRDSEGLAIVSTTVRNVYANGKAAAEDIAEYMEQRWGIENPYTVVETVSVAANAPIAFDKGTASKADVIAELTRLGIPHDSKSKKDDLLALLPV